jgi:hypothetical protein
VRQVLLVLACAAALSGCASEGLWAKVGATPADFDRDKIRCGVQAGYESAARGMTKDELQRMCLRERGWQQARSDTHQVSLQPPVSDANCDKNGVCNALPMR